MIDELLPGDRVSHQAAGRTATVLKLARRWYGLDVALVRFDSDRIEAWVPRGILSRVDMRAS